VSDRLQGKVALVTGGAGGIGAAIVRAFVAQGAQVVIADRAEAAGAALAEETGTATRFVRLDVTRSPDWADAVAATVAAFGGLDVLVNNAGAVHALKPLDQVTDAEWDRVISVGLTGAFFGTRAVTAPMRERGGGAIINMSSIMGLHGVNGSVGYCAAKAGLRGLTKAAAADLGRHGIRVNSIHPGLIDAGMGKGLAYDLRKVPIRRAGLAEEVAAMAVFLASDEASYSTASEFTVDGGDHGARVLG